MRATEIVKSVKGMPYEERLRKLKLPTMTYRRARGLMMEVWKHINSYDTAVIYQHSSLPDQLGTPFSSNVSTLWVVSLSLSIIWHLWYGMSSPWQLERQSVGIHLKKDWTRHWRGHPMRLDYPSNSCDVTDFGRTHFGHYTNPTT